MREREREKEKSRTENDRRTIYVVIGDRGNDAETAKPDPWAIREINSAPAIN